MAKDKDYRVAITGIYLRNGDFARGRTVVKGSQLIDLDKALEAGYVVEESEAKEVEKSVAAGDKPKKLTAAQQKIADDAQAKKDLEDAHLMYAEKFFSDAPKDATLEQLNTALNDDKPIDAV
jgi:hypothetical protein